MSIRIDGLYKGFVDSNGIDKVGLELILKIVQSVKQGGYGRQVS